MRPPLPFWPCTPWPKRSRRTDRVTPPRRVVSRAYVIESVKFVVAVCSGRLITDLLGKCHRVPLLLASNTYFTVCLRMPTDQHIGRWTVRRLRPGPRPGAQPSRWRQTPRIPVRIAGSAALLTASGQTEATAWMASPTGVSPATSSNVIPAAGMSKRASSTAATSSRGTVPRPVRTAS